MNTNHIELIKLNPDDEALRLQFNQLFAQTFGFDFELWYQEGYWPKEYQPYLMMQNQQVIASVSVYEMTFSYHQASKKYAQIGGVVTHPDFQQRGYGRRLMRWVLAQYQDSWQQIFLYCHDGVVDFYLKFGFIESHEYAYRGNTKNFDRNMVTISDDLSVDKLDIYNEEHFALLEQGANQGNPLAAFYMEKSMPLLMFYAMYFYSDSLYYIAKYKLIFIVSWAEDKMIIHEILGDNKDVDYPMLTVLVATISRQCGKKTSEFQLGFTPIKKEEYEQTLLAVPNQHLMVLEPKENITMQEQVMFPVLSHT